MKSGNFSVLELSGPVQACTGIANLSIRIGDICRIKNGVHTRTKMK
jgi:hypothetical protein